METKSNYQAWDIDSSQFPEEGNINDQLLFLLRFVILAPSGHNSQPWRFSIKDNSVNFYIEKSRSLEESDPSGRQLMISFGCALENFLIAASHFGFNTQVVYFPNDENSNIIASLTCHRVSPVSSDNLTEAIMLRHTDRGPYKPKSLNPEFLNAIFHLSSPEMKLFMVDDLQQKEKIVSIVSKAQVNIMDNVAFRNELSLYVKSSYTNSKNGIPGFALGLPAPVSLLASWLVKKMNLAQKTQKQDNAILRKTPAYMIIATQNDDKYSWIKAGQFFERLWLMACKDKMVCSPMAAVIQEKESRENLQKLLNTDLYPHVFFRIGFPEKASRPTPRYLVEDLILSIK